MSHNKTHNTNILFRIFNKFSIQQRLILMVLAVLIPLLVMGFMIYKEQARKMEFFTLENEGTKVVLMAVDFNNNLAVHRGLSSRYHGGDKSNEIISELSKIESELDRIDLEIEKFGKTASQKLHVTSGWEKISKDYKKLKDTYKTVSSLENLEIHSNAIDNSLKFITKLGDASGLVLDPNSDTYYIMDLSIFKMPFLAETVGKTRAYGISLLNKKNNSNDEFEKFIFLYQDLLFYSKFSKDSLEMARKYNPDEKIFSKEEIDKLNSIIENYISVIKKEIVTAKELTITPSEYFKIATVATNAIFEVNKNTSGLLVKKLDENLVKETKILYLVYVLLAGTLLGTIFLAIVLTKSITSQIETLVARAKEFAEKIKDGILDSRMSEEEIGTDFKAIPPGINDIVVKMVEPIEEASKVMAEMANGNLREYVNGEYKGGHAEIKNSLNKTLDSFNEILGVMIQAVSEVHGGAGQISEASQSLAQGSSEQAASVEEISAAVTELSSQTKQASENAKRANELSTHTLTSSKKGEEMMSELKNAMNQIKNASDNISKIIKAIDEIAFQTNLLSLNAAVEAARAGKHGKGFAVVAEEVKRLSDRSAKAARETADLIQESINKANNGVDIAEKTFIALTEISESVNEVATLMKEVVIASDEQVKGLVEIEKSMQQIEQVTQTNASNSEEIASSSTELAGQAESMSEIIAKFHIKDSNQPPVNPAQSKKTQEQSRSHNAPVVKKAVSQNGNGSHKQAKIDPEKVISLEDKEFEGY
ncbi:MAG: methyl-accepting chemotaxis protein [Leptospiraceae bacterium]|nr:hypothetical protein [Leptospiraceae bacterium]MCK6382043.1 methyl-accepting chemotaxis protein [Leptospiraceae bacterium]NUM40808.1 hypothetical protein [Leptospiraceae bacterium]